MQSVLFVMPCEDATRRCAREDRAAIMSGGAPVRTKDQNADPRPLLDTTTLGDSMSNTAAHTVSGSTASPEELALAELIVSALNLEVVASDIDPAAPLYRDGLGLDSIDILEVALVVSKTYGVKIRSDDENNLKIFGSLRSLNDHIQQHRTH
jgi:acyl carrier protein